MPIKFVPPSYHRNLGAQFRRTKMSFGRIPCWLVLAHIFAETKLDWSFDDLRWMTGYSQFTIANGLSTLRKMSLGHPIGIEKEWNPKERAFRHHLAISRTTLGALKKKVESNA